MLKASLRLFTGSLLGKLAGALREMLLAGLFGTSGIVAALRAAQSATLIPVNFFTSDALSAGFLPLYSRYQHTDPRRASALFWWVAGLLFTVSVVVVAILMFAAPYWIRLLVPGFGSSERAQTVEFLRIMGAGVPFYIAGGLFSYLEMGHASYRLASARASLQSAGMIVGTIAAYFFRVPSLLAWGFTAAYMVYSGLGLHLVVRHRWAPWPENLSLPSLRQTGVEFWHVVKPLLLLPILLQGSIAAERAVASLLGIDVSAALDYAKFITDTGVLLLAVPLGLAGLSTISRMGRADTQLLLARVLPPLLLATMPFSVALAAHGQLVVSVIYERGHFGEESTRLTSAILWGFAIGFWAQVASYVLMKALSAQLRNVEVFRFMAIALLSNVLIDFGCYRWLGPSVLGIGSCSYGLALLFFSSRALGLGRLVGERVIWLSLGSLGYAVSATLMPVHGLLSVPVVAAFFLVYWVAYSAVVPVLRRDVSLLWNTWRLRAA